MSRHIESHAYSNAHSSHSLAIARIFGGIPASFFATYHQHLPKSEPQDQYDLRADLYELYHYLNHTVLFGVGAFKLVLYCYIVTLTRESSIGRICRKFKNEDGQIIERNPVMRMASSRFS